MQGEVLARLAAVNVGLPAFAEAIESQGAPVVDVEWRPPARGDRETVRALERLWGVHAEVVARANDEVVRRIETAQPRAVTVAPAREMLPILSSARVLLHSGTTIEWERVCDPQRRALAAACVFEDWARSIDEAQSLLAAGDIALYPGNEHGHVGPMTGVCSPSMPVWMVEDEGSGALA